MPPTSETRSTTRRRLMWKTGAWPFTGTCFSAISATSSPRVFRFCDGCTATNGLGGMIRAFLHGIRCHTPLFPEIPREFLQYLQDAAADHPDDPPFALELAHYEWVEIALDLDETELTTIPADRAGRPAERRSGAVAPGLATGLPASRCTRSAPISSPPKPPQAADPACWSTATARTR